MAIIYHYCTFKFSKFKDLRNLKTIKIVLIYKSKEFLGFWNKYIKRYSLKICTK